MLPLTIVVVSILFIISFLIFDKDLLAPPTAVALVFLFGCFCCFYNEEKWGLEFSPKSLGLIAAGIIATMIGGALGVFLSNYPKVGSFSFSHERIEPREIHVSGLKTAVVIVFQLVTLYLVYSHVRRISGYSNWIEAVTRYKEILKQTSIADIDDSSNNMPFLTRNMLQASNMISIVYSYIVGNNLVAAKKKLSINWIPVVLYTMTTFMRGDRSNAIRLWIIILVVAYTIHKRSVGWRSNRKTTKLVRNIAISVVIVGIAFSGFREVVGRKSSLDPLYYVTFYAGAPTAVLNQVWENPITKPDVFGERILYYLNTSTTALFGWPGRYRFYYDYMYSPNGSTIGNAPTAFRPAYVEFGFWGFMAFFIACGAFFTILYCKCRKRSGNNPIEFRLLVYAYISYVFLMYFYSTFFDFLGHVFIKYLIELLLIRWALVGWQFKHRVRLTFGQNRRKPEQITPGGPES